MLEQLLHIDTEVLLAINGWHAPWADRLMWIVSAKTTWIPLYLLLVGLLVWRYYKPAMTSVKWLQKVPACVVMIVVIGLAVGAADFIASGILKDWVARPRPSRVPELEGVLHLVNNYRSGQYGFVSSHASTTMACAVLFSLIWRNKIATVGLMLWVAINCYSRMYLGVHYPLDIIGGLVVGTIVAVVAYLFLCWTKVVDRYAMKELSNCKDSVVNEAFDRCGDS
jgi:undecaprenyl-diphosphatase